MQQRFAAFAVFFGALILVGAGCAASSGDEETQGSAMEQKESMEHMEMKEGSEVMHDHDHDHEHDDHDASEANKESMEMSDADEAVEASEENNDVMATADIFSIVPEESTVTYSSMKKIGSGHTGTVAVKSGAVTLSDGMPIAGSIIMDMNVITDDKGSQGFVNHVKGDDFFNVAQFPESSFTLNSAKKTGDNTFMLEGTMSIKGVTNPVSFPATISVENGELNATASFSIDRTLWGITFGSGKFFDNLGDSVIEDNIDYTITLVGRP